MGFIKLRILKDVLKQNQPEVYKELDKIIKNGRKKRTTHKKVFNGKRKEQSKKIVRLVQRITS